MSDFALESDFAFPLPVVNEISVHGKNLDFKADASMMDLESILGNVSTLFAEKVTELKQPSHEFQPYDNVSMNVLNFVAVAPDPSQNLVSLPIPGDYATPVESIPSPILESNPDLDQSQFFVFEIMKKSVILAMHILARAGRPLLYSEIVTALQKFQVLPQSLPMEYSNSKSSKSYIQSMTEFNQLSQFPRVALLQPEHPLQHIGDNDVFPREMLWGTPLTLSMVSRLPIHSSISYFPTLSSVCRYTVPPFPADKKYGDMQMLEFFRDVIDHCKYEGRYPAFTTSMFIALHHVLFEKKQVAFGFTNQKKSLGRLKIKEGKKNNWTSFFRRYQATDDLNESEIIWVRQDIDINLQFAVIFPSSTLYDRQLNSVEADRLPESFWTELWKPVPEEYHLHFLIPERRQPRAQERNRLGRPRKNKAKKSIVPSEKDIFAMIPDSGKLDISNADIDWRDVDPDYVGDFLGLADGLNPILSSQQDSTPPVDLLAPSGSSSSVEELEISEFRKRLHYQHALHTYAANIHTSKGILDLVARPVTPSVKTSIPEVPNQISAVPQAIRNRVGPRVKHCVPITGPLKQTFLPKPSPNLEPISPKKSICPMNFKVPTTTPKILKRRVVVNLGSHLPIDKISSVRLSTSPSPAVLRLPKLEKRGNQESGSKRIRVT